ncbi:MAG: helix-turn-helix domain-containing protein [Bacteroidia bacterium]
MNNKITFTQLSTNELKKLIGSQLKSSLKELDFTPQTQKPRIGGVALAQEITGYTPSSIYSMVSRGKIPHFKRDGRLLFNEEKLRKWLTEGDLGNSFNQFTNLKKDL